MQDLRLALMCGTDIPIPECALTAHQPKLSEIAFIGETDYFIGMQCLCIDKSMLGDFSSQDQGQINNFTVFMTMLAQPEMKDKKKAVIDTLDLIFGKWKVAFTPRSLIFTANGQNPCTVDETNFEPFQNTLREIFCVKNGPMDQQAFNPKDAKAKEIADKLMRGRQRVAAQQSANEGGSAFARYISILTIGTNTMNIQDVSNLTMFQLYDLIERYFLHLNWDMDIRTRLAGGDPKSQPEDWMKNLH